MPPDAPYSPAWGSGDGDILASDLPVAFDGCWTSEAESGVGRGGSCSPLASPASGEHLASAASPQSPLGKDIEEHAEDFHYSEEEDYLHSYDTAVAKDSAPPDSWSPGSQVATTPEVLSDVEVEAALQDSEPVWSDSAAVPVDTSKAAALLGVVVGGSLVPLSPRLSALTVDRPDLASFLGTHGVPNLVRFAFGLSEAEVPAHLHACWHLANEIADAAAVSAARTRIDAEGEESPASVAKGPRDPAEAPSPVVPSRSQSPVGPPLKRRRAKPSAHRQLELPLLDEAPGAPPASGVENRKATSLANGLIKILQAEIAHSKRAEQLQGLEPSAICEYFELVSRGLASYSVSTLRAAAAAWSRWSLWSSTNKKGSAVLPGTAVHLHIFLESVRKGVGVRRRNAGGIHAARRVHTGITFLAAQLGLDFDLSFVKIPVPAPSDPPPKHCCNDPLVLRDLALASYYIKDPHNDLYSYVSLLVLVLFSGGVRFAHAQRSRLLRQVPEGLIFLCTRGKSRYRGQVAPPFDWAVPFSPLFTSDHATLFLQLHKAATPASCSYLVPRLAPAGCTLAGAKGFAPRPACDGQWRSTLREFIASAPSTWPPRSSGSPGARGTRRALASVAEVLELSHHERLPLGSWVDAVGEEGKRFSKLPATYVANDTKLWSQFAAKSKIATAIGQALQELKLTEFASQGWEGPVADYLRSAYRPTVLATQDTTRQKSTAKQSSSSSSSGSSASSSSSTSS